MTRSISKGQLIRLFLIILAAGCFIGAYQFYECAMSYLGEMFDNPRSSAAMTGTKMMKTSVALFITGLLSLAIWFAMLVMKASKGRSLHE